MPHTVAEHFVRVMGLTLEDFLRMLPAAVGHPRYKVDGREAVVDHPQGCVSICLQPTTQRKLGALSLPATPVEFRFSGLDEAARRQFLERFERYFQRGGG